MILSSAYNIGHLGYKQKVSLKSKQSMNICTDFSFYSEGWGYLFTYNVFTHKDKMT